MTVENKISTIIESQFPSFVREEGPVFIDFVEAYYEWLEQSGNLTDATKNLLNYRSIDKTPDVFLDYFHDEFLANIPKNVLVDRRLLLKHIKDFYRARGSEKAYRLLFRILYNEEISFYYPGDDILRASDGRWHVDKILRALGGGDVYSMSGYEIVGATSGATAIIETVLNILVDGVQIFELYLSNIDGEFIDGETITSTNGITAIAQGPVNNVQVTFGGAYHRVGDRVVAMETNEVARVSEINDYTAVNFELLDGGSGYRANSTVVISGGSGFGANFTIDSIVDTETVDVNTDLILGLANVAINFGPRFNSSPDINLVPIGLPLETANSSTRLGNALSYETITVGSIGSISIANVGYQYTQLPSAGVVDDQIYGNRIDDGNSGYKGNNAVIAVSHAPGAIQEVTFSTVNKSNLYDIGETMVFENQTRDGTWNTHASVEGKGGVYVAPGRWTTTNGFLSWDKYLQDNLYYQEYSYEIRSDQFISKYRDVLNRLVHPSGTKMFGRVVNKTVADMQPEVISLASPFKVKIVTTNAQLADSVTANTVVYTFTQVDTRVALEPTTIAVGPVNVYPVEFTYDAISGTHTALTSDVISGYSANTIATFSGLDIGELGDGSVFYGTGSLYQTELANNSFIVVHDNTNTYADQGFTVTGTPTSNTLLDVAPSYSGTVSGATIYVRSTL